MKRQYLQRAGLPDEPGIYVFRDYANRPLYIGRATSLRDRVKSYFSNDLIDTRGPRIVDMVTRAKRLTFQETDSVLEAILLEGSEIKKYQPKYNVDEKDDKSSQYVVITDEPWPRVFLTRARDYDQSPYKVLKIFGPYPYGGLIKEALKVLRKLFPFKDKKSYDPRHDRFYKALGKSPDGDDADEEARQRYLKTIEYLIWFFQGKKKLLRKKLAKEMAMQAAEMRFEEAGQTKRLLYALDHINDIALIKADIRQGLSSPGADFRIEAYDIAHLSGTNVVGAMTVYVNGQPDPSQYRKFKISRQANNDTAGLAEVLMRRLNHSEWPYPNLIVVDGNEAQRKVAESVLKARYFAVPVVAVTKNEKHKADKLVGDKDLIGRYGKEIIAVNAEAHRFAITFHRKRRSSIFKQTVV